jgi:hypothetical protein
MSGIAEAATVSVKLNALFQGVASVLWVPLNRADRRKEHTMKLAIVVLADPKQGEEALGRLFNALALASEAQRAGDDVQLVFQGAGTRWPEQLAKLDHPARGLYQSVREVVTGASQGCAVVFGATASVKAAGVPELHGNQLPGGPALGSIRSLLADDRRTLVF